MMMIDAFFIIIIIYEKKYLIKKLKHKNESRNI